MGCFLPVGENCRYGGRIKVSPRLGFLELGAWEGVEVKYGDSTGSPGGLGWGGTTV